MKTQFTYENVNTSSIKFALNNAKSALATHSDGISRIANDITEEEWKGSSKAAFLGVFPKFSTKSKEISSRLDKLHNILEKIDSLQITYKTLRSFINLRDNVTPEYAEQLQLSYEEALATYQATVDSWDRSASDEEAKIKGMSV